MREYEFRGKRKDNGEWVYGDLIQLHDGRKFIVNNKFGACFDNKGNFINTEAPFVCEVDSETVGQYTEKLDSKANKIFEKDIVKGIRRTNPYEEYEYFVVKFHNGCFMVGNFNMHEFFDKFFHKEVIGNIHDSLELLGGRIE